MALSPFLPADPLFGETDQPGTMISLQATIVNSTYISCTFDKCIRMYYFHDKRCYQVDCSCQYCRQSEQVKSEVADAPESTYFLAAVISSSNGYFVELCWTEHASKSVSLFIAAEEHTKPENYYSPSEQLSEQQGGAASHQCEHHTKIDTFNDQKTSQCRKTDAQAAFARAAGACRRSWCGEQPLDAAIDRFFHPQEWLRDSKARELWLFDRVQQDFGQRARQCQRPVRRADHYVITR